MKSSTKRFLSFIISLAFFTAGVIIYTTLIVPEFDSIQNLRGTLSGREKFYSEQKDIFDRMSKLLKNYQGQQSLKDQVNVAVPNDPSISNALSDIQAIAAANKLALLATNTALPALKAQNKNSYIRNQGNVKIGIGLRGSYSDFKNFVSQIETNVRLMDVRQVSVRAADPKFGSQIYLFDLVINAYYQDITTLVDNATSTQAK